MSTALAEQPLQTETWQAANLDYPEIMEEARREFTQFVGSTVLKHEAHLELVNTTTLLADAQSAALGHSQAAARVETAIFTDVSERNYKAGHFTEVCLQMSCDGLEQDGRKLIDVHTNNLQFSELNAEMRQKSTYEGTNAVAFKLLHQAGLLEKNAALVISPTSSKMTTQEKREYGMFVETDSCSLQLLTVEGQDALLQTAMVAGKTAPDAPRHDMKAIQKMLEEHGVTAKITDGTETVSYVILIPKSELQGGIVSVVEKYDQAAGGTFYGLPNTGQNYQEHAALCRRRNTGMAGLVAKIKQEFLANIHQATSPLDAVLMLDALSDEFCGEHASLVDHTIDARIFGPGSYHIEEARRLQLAGDFDGALQSVKKAQAVSDSSSCPLFKGVQSENERGDSGGEQSSKKKFMKCPFCSARVWGDPCAKAITCTDCSASVKDGRVTSKGDGGHKVRAAKAQAEADAARKQAVLRAKEHEAAMAAQVDQALAERGWDAAKFTGAQAISKQAVATNA